MGMEIEQMTIFDYREQILPYSKGDKVKVKINQKSDEDPESYFYLLEFKNKRGIVTEVIEKPVLQYRVAFEDKEAILYHDEICI